MTWKNPLGLWNCATSDIFYQWRLWHIKQNELKNEWRSISIKCLLKQFVFLLVFPSCGETQQSWKQLKFLCCQHVEREQTDRRRSRKRHDAGDTDKGIINVCRCYSLKSHSDIPTDALCLKESVLLHGKAPRSIIPFDEYHLAYPPTPQTFNNLQYWLETKS